MFIKEVLEYDYNYAEYMVTDGKNDLCCMCLSVPLPDNQVPKAGMEVKMIYAFAYKDIKIEKVQSKQTVMHRTDYFQYNLTGQVLDTCKALVGIGGFVISLENEYQNGFPANISTNDYVSFNVDRLDCIL